MALAARFLRARRSCGLGVPMDMGPAAPACQSCPRALRRMLPAQARGAGPSVASGRGGGLRQRVRGAGPRRRFGRASAALASLRCGGCGDLRAATQTVNGGGEQLEGRGALSESISAGAEQMRSVSLLGIGCCILWATTSSWCSGGYYVGSALARQAVSVICVFVDASFSCRSFFSSPQGGSGRRSSAID